MSEHLSAAAPPQTASIGQARPERRQLRRAGIALQVRIRTADFNDGEFDEVRTTQNASRKAIYFFTELNRYYKGMRVRVTSPYDPKEGAMNLEQIGEVARVHRRENGYGVAVVILTGSQATAVQAGQGTTTPRGVVQEIEKPSTAGSERRCAARSPFIAPVEIHEMRTGSRTQARTSDLSMQGCYVDTLNPLPVGAALRLQIHRGGLILDVLATVSSTHVGSGMGLDFGEVTGPQRTVLDGWLSELTLPPRTIIENPFPVMNKTTTAGGDCAMRLLQVLLRKGLISQSDAREILSDGLG